MIDDVKKIHDTIHIVTAFNDYKKRVLLSRADLAELSTLIEESEQNEHDIAQLLIAFTRQKDDEKIRELLLNLRTACLNYTGYFNQVNDAIKKVSEYYD